jgi:5-methyltetrahydrofolate--homocysteine methyltransferase
LDDAKKMLDYISKNKALSPYGVFKFIDTRSESFGKFTFPRVNTKREGKTVSVSLTDFVSAIGDIAGVFLLSAAFGLSELQRDWTRSGRDYEAVLAGILAGTLTEAFSEVCALHAGGIAGQPVVLRPAFGYPCCPNHKDKAIALSLLGTEQTAGFSLTESGMIIPAASVCGLYFFNEGAFYF